MIKNIDIKFILFADIKRFVYVLDEEQEKEIEYEPEEQRQVERPMAVKAAVPSFNRMLEKLIVRGLNMETVLSTKSILFSLETGLQNTKLFKEYENDARAWTNHIFVTEDFIHVLEVESQANDDFLRPVWWIARVEDENDKGYILILLSSYECNHLLPAFMKSTKSTLYMFRPRLSKMHSDLLEVHELRVVGRNLTADIDPNDIAQIKVYAGSMYFRSEVEQNAYCNFLGLIPRPRNSEQEMAFENGIIKPNGFVPKEHRNRQLLVNNVGRCNFESNPVNLAIRLIEAHHQFVRKESHAAMILERGKKLPIN